MSEGSNELVLSFALHDLSNGRWQTQRAQRQVATASTYKLPLLLYVAMQVAQGILSWEQPLTLKPEHKSWGTGILKDLSPGLSLPLRDVCYLMTAHSDNTATDMLVDWLGVEAVNQTLQSLGLEQTRLYLQTQSPSPCGRPPLAVGSTTPAEMAGLLSRLAKGELGLQTDLVLGMLAAQQDRSMIPRYLPAGWQYAGKTGCNADLRADVGILTKPSGERLVLAVFAEHIPTEDWSVDSPGVLAIAQLARELLS